MPDGAGCFTRDSSGPALLRISARHKRIPGTGLSPPAARLPRTVPLCVLRLPCGSYNPARASTPAVWAPPLSLTTTRGIIVIFSSSAYLDVSVRRVRLPCRDGPCGPGCPIRTSADRRPFAPTRGFSQLATSFIASESQGILRAPLSNFFVLSVYRYTRLYSRSCTLASSSPSCH